MADAKADDDDEAPQIAARVETLIESWTAIRLALVGYASELAGQIESLRAQAIARTVDRQVLSDLADALEAVTMRIANSLETIDRLTEQAQQTARMSKDDVG